MTISTSVWSAGQQSILTKPVLEGLKNKSAKLPKTLSQYDRVCKKLRRIILILFCYDSVSQIFRVQGASAKIFHKSSQIKKKYQTYKERQTDRKKEKGEK